MVLPAERPPVVVAPVVSLPVDVDVDEPLAVAGSDAAVVPEPRLPARVETLRLGLLIEIAECPAVSPAVSHPLLVPPGTAGELGLAVRGHVGVQERLVSVGEDALGVPGPLVGGEAEGVEPQTEGHLRQAQQGGVEQLGLAESVRQHQAAVCRQDLQTVSQVCEENIYE